MDNHSTRVTLRDRLRDAVAAFRGESRLSLFVIVVALVLLPALAFLQYHWLGQLSEGERERMATNLRRAMQQMRNDMDRTVTRAYEAFLLEPRGGQETLEERTSRFVAWLDATQNRSLVRRFLISDHSVDGETTLLAFDAQKMQFVPAEWNDDLSEFKEAPFRGILHRAGSAIAAPRFCPTDTPSENRRPMRFCGWAIAELNLDYAATQILPPLIDRYLGSDYFVEVVREPAAKDSAVTPLYTSNNGLMANPDWTETMLQPRPDLLWRDGLRNRQGRGPGDNRGPNDGRGIGDGRGTGDNRGPGDGRDRADIRTGPPPDPSSPRAGGFRPPEKRGPGPQPRPGMLEVRVKHRTGSVEAAVDRTRHLNIAISVVILGLLTGCVVLLHRSASRERKLAQLQMDFIAGVSHELRTPLSAAKALSENLADGLVHSDEQVRFYGRLLRDQTQGLSEVVEQILRLAGIQSGRAALNLQPVPLSEVLDRAVEAASPELEQAHCRVERDTQEPLPAVMADAASLSHCIRNLLSNAAKYGDASGCIKLSARRSPDPNANQVWISVEDRGPGIEPSEMRHLFQPFFRGRRAMEDQVHGLGLGLALVKRIIDAHSGNVDVQSKPGEGSCFTLRLPAAQMADL